MYSFRMPRVVPLALLVLAAACDGDEITSAKPEPQPQVPNFVQLQSDPGDYIGRGLSYRYTQADAVLRVSAAGNALSLRVDGDETWSGEFRLPSSVTRIQPGTYANLRRYPFHNPVDGGLSLSGEGRGCNMLTGSLTITTATYAADTLKAVDLTFEQHCEGAAPALRGTIHWRADDTTGTAGPVNPPPAGLWQPAPGSTPNTARYVHLVSDRGDYIGGGSTYTYSDVAVVANAGHVSVSAGGWSGEFRAMNSLTQLRVGYYGSLQRFPFHNPARGGLSWYGQGRGCNTLTGWFVVDRVTYSGTRLTALDLRFEQHCEGGVPALRGVVRWSE